jgi:hypothetical protein
MKTLACLAWLLAAAAGASAQTAVWRCGAAYGDAPCPGGTLVAVADGRDAEARAQAREVLARDLALADRLRREREALQRENAVKGSGLAGIKPAAPAEPVRLQAAAPKKPAKPAQRTHRLHRDEAAGTSPSAARASRSPAG